MIGFRRGSYSFLETSEDHVEADYWQKLCYEKSAELSPAEYDLWWANLDKNANRNP